MLDNVKRNCPNCGAPITTEVCPYCNNMTGLDTKCADMEYPVIECKEASIRFVNFWLPMIFALSFGFFGFVFPLIFCMVDFKAFAGVILICLPFALISVIAFVIGIKSLIRYFSIKHNGKDIYATVYGYMDDNLFINGNPAQIVKLLVQSNDGPKFILYQLGDIKQPFKVNSQIKLKVYKDIFLIENKKQYYF